MNNSTASPNVTRTNTTASNDTPNNVTNIASATTTVKHSASFISEKPTEHILIDVQNVERKEKKKKEDWWFILIITASSCIMIVALVLAVLVFRHKKKNGVWFKGLFLRLLLELHLCGFG